MPRFTRASVATVLVLGIAALLAPKVGERPRVTAPEARPIRVLPPDSVIAGPVLAEYRVRNYLLQIIHDTVENDRIADIKLQGHRVYAVRAMDVRFDPVGVDITGDRIPDVVVHQFSGGIHCCSRATIFSLGDSLVELGTINGGDGEVTLEDVDGDGLPEIRVADWRFAYWRNYAFVETQAPEVLFRFRDGAYRVACDLMAREAPDSLELRARARELTDGWRSGDPPSDFWGYAVDLVYQGHADLALGWLDRSWPSSIPGKTEFLRALREKLRGSPCWDPGGAAPSI
jgi:hypothetical protein